MAGSQTSEPVPGAAQVIDGRVSPGRPRSRPAQPRGSPRPFVHVPRSPSGSRAFTLFNPPAPLVLTGECVDDLCHPTHSRDARLAMLLNLDVIFGPFLAVVALGEYTPPCWPWWCASFS